MSATIDSTTSTIGMKLDAFVSNLDSLPSTQLYGIIVGLTVLISFTLLAGGGGGVVDVVGVSPIMVEKKVSANSSAGPQPKWFVLKWLNVIFVAAFLLSVIHFSWHAQTYLNDSSSSLYFLVGWSLFLCYFFGFFGISFVDITDEDLVSSNSSASAVSETTTKPKKSVLHPPAASAPVCSDPVSSSSRATTNTTTSKDDIKAMDNDAIAQLVLTGQMKDHELEKVLDAFRAVDVRRIIMQDRLSSLLGKDTHCLKNLPVGPSLDYAQVHGANCEIVVGYVPLPVGMVGPLTLNDESVYIPMATTEGCLVASTQRGAKAISQGKLGAVATIVRDGITRAPCLRMNSAKEAALLKLWCETPIHFASMKAAFESTTSFGKLKGCNPTIAGRNIYLRLICFSGDAMGMNMVSKGSLAVIDLLRLQFPSLQLVALSGNMCTDKKAAATNWLEGRGKSVVVEAIIPQKVVRATLKTTVAKMVHTNLHKNLIGSAMAGTIGGFNAHASNIVTAVFLATGQDPAQNVESSNCITLLEETEDGDLWISCTMPSLEVGTVGGGTSLPAQAACLKAIGVQGGGVVPGANARKLATVVAAATMAGELSLLAALAANTLVQAHMKHNRKAPSKK
mmetsp:Transcript_2860/g.4615  ORF Transcript_2860/g.4615 Transcript_2860/m.4615 type:complete len:621 (-) Transcript_2860:153-2015(-)